MYSISYSIREGAVGIIPTFYIWNAVQTSFQVESVMEYRPNFHPELSASIRPDSLNHMLKEHYITHRAVVNWDCPKQFFRYIYLTAMIVHQQAM